MKYEDYLDEVTTLIVEKYGVTEAAAIKIVVVAQDKEFFVPHDDTPEMRNIDQAHLDARALLIERVEQGLADGSLAIGEAVRRLRTEVTGLHQSQFAKMCKISVRTLVHIEHGEGNQTLKSLNAVFRPFGLQMGVVKVRREWDD